MKQVLRDILSLWKWILGISVYSALILYGHHIVMSGVNPYISNSFVIIVYIFIILFVYLVFSKRKEFLSKSFLAIIISILLIYCLSYLFTEILVYSIFNLI